MPIPVVCAECKSRLNAPDAAAGKTLRCPKCKMALVVPAAAAAPEFEVVDEEPAPAKKPAAAPPAKKTIVVEDDDDPDERPKAKKRPRDDDEDDRPRARKRPRDDDDEEEEDDEERPLKKKKAKKTAAAGMSPAVIAAIVGGVLVAGGGAFAAYWFGIREKPVESVKNNNETPPANGAPPKSAPGGRRPRPSEDATPRDVNSRMSNNNLKQLGLGFHNVASTYNFELPTGIYDSTGKVGLSWRVAMLPFIEHGELYKQFHLSEPWDSPHNKQLISKMPRTYAKPGTDPSNGMTHYRTITGSGTIFPPPAPGKGGTLAFGLKLTAIRDGTSNTALVVEAVDPVEWTRPDDLVYLAGGPLPKLGGISPDGYMIALADGSVRWFKGGASEQTLRALCTATAGDLPGPDY